MTSSSDSDFPLLRRRLFVHGIPSRTSPGSLKDFFSTFGSVSGVHNSLKGYAFITFEEEEGANEAIKADSAQFQGRTIHVEFAHAHNHPTPPVTGARRLINFPKPFGARGGGISISGACGGAARQSSSSNLFPQSSSTSLPRWRPTHVTTTGAGRGSRSGRARGAAQRHQRSTRQQQQLFCNNVRVVHCLRTGEDEISATELEEKHAKLFLAKCYPHVAKKIFLYLDCVSLMRCKLVSKAWRDNVAEILDNPRVRAFVKSNWLAAECSFFPVNPIMYEESQTDILALMEENPDSYYRNVLSLKCDELELILAVDNGNVEIYDRCSLRLKAVLVGKFSSSPATLDFNRNIILVSYTCGFGRAGRRFASCWNIYDRTSKRLLHSIERNSDDFVRIGGDGENDLLLTAPSAVYRVYNYDSSHMQMKKVFTTNEADQIEALDVDLAFGFVVGIVRHDQEEKKLMLHLWKRPDDGFCEEESAVDFMTNLVTLFPLLDCYESSSFQQAKCKCLSVQIRYPQCLCFFSNAYGYFEYFEDRGKPYSLIGLYDLLGETCLRIVTIDSAWMTKHSIVPYDYDSGILSAKFNDFCLVLGFGSYSDRKDGGIALWLMEELLDPEVPEEDLTVTSLPAPSYHSMGWDGHTGGVHALHLDRFQLVAVNGCVHQVATRCIEGGDESRKDNVLVYDFWRPGCDRRRRWSGGSSRREEEEEVQEELQHPLDNGGIDADGDG